MKTKIAIIGLAFALALVTTGCKTTGATGGSPFFTTDTNGIVYVNGNEITPQAVGGALQAAAAFGANYEISHDANARDYFVAAKAVIDLAVANGQYSSTNLQAALSTISIKELKNSASVQSTIATVLTLYNADLGQYAAGKIGGVSPYLVPMLQGISAGFGAATSTAPGPASAPSP